MKVQIQKYQGFSQNEKMKLFPKRNADTHKGSYGKVLLLCGSIGCTGAAVLAAKAACRTGSGLVYVGVPKSIYPIVASQLTEPVIFPLEDFKTGHFAEENFHDLSTRLTSMDAVLLGPGCGKSESLRNLILHFLRDTDLPVILDADAINVFEDSPELLREHRGSLILTPHDGEFYRIYRDKMSDRYTEARTLSKRLNAVVLRKGNHTLVTDGRNTYRNCTGNPGMAKGGSGDVLAGIMVSLLGRKHPAYYAAAGAVYLHGLSGDYCAKLYGEEGMLPSDMIDALPFVIQAIQ